MANPNRSKTKTASLMQAAQILREVAMELKTSGLSKSANWGDESLETDTLDDYMSSQYSEDYDEMETVKRTSRAKSASARSSYGRPVTEDFGNSPRIDRYASIDQEFLDLDF